MMVRVVVVAVAELSTMEQARAAAARELMRPTSWARERKGEQESPRQKSWAKEREGGERDQSFRLESQHRGRCRLSVRLYGSANVSKRARDRGDWWECIHGYVQYQKKSGV